jgi:fermentation-respiration switch protein FrsA (DUF1100 family)
MLESILSVSGVCAAAYVVLCLLVFLRQASYVYYPDRRVDATPADIGLRFEDVRLTVPGGDTVAAWYVPAAMEPARTAIFCHGNGGDLGDWIETVRTLHGLGFHVLIFDYRGYGQSTGEPSERATYEDAKAAWDWLTVERQTPPDRIVVYGRSLGGSVAAWLAAEVRPGALVVESAFASAAAMAARMFPYLPTRLLCRYRYDTRAAASRARCPVLVAHGPSDEMVPFAHGRRIFEAAPEPKRFVEIPGRHNDGGLDVDPAFRQALMEFLDRHAPLVRATPTLGDSP